MSGFGLSPSVWHPLEYLMDCALVTFSTLLRKKLFDYISQDITIMAPSTLKIEACKLTYAPINEGKKKIKLVYKNNDGVLLAIIFGAV